MPRRHQALRVLVHLQPVAGPGVAAAVTVEFGGAPVREADVATRAKQQGPVTLEEMTAALLEAIPVDDRWYRVTAEFTAHALRNPSLKRVMAARENAILATILPLVEAGLAGVGRRATDTQALGRALVAVHDGTTVQCLMEPESDTVRRARTNLFVSVLRNYSEEV